MNGAYALRLFFHGLIAFVHDRPADDMMTAYLLKDAHHAPYISIASHCPTPAAFGNTFCQSSGPWCICHLGDPVILSFDPMPMTQANSIRDKPRRERPASVTEAGYFEWLIRMTNVDRASAEAKPESDLTPHVLAYMSFGWSNARSCHLDQVEEKDCTECRFRVHPFKFISNFAEPSGTFVHEQALTEYAMFDLSFAAQPLRLTIHEKGGTGRIDLPLACQGQKCQDVLIGNAPKGHSAGHQEGLENLGIHFLNYYSLSANSKPDRKVPVRLNRGTFRVPASPELSSDLDGGQLYTCENGPLLDLVNYARTQAPTAKEMNEDHSMATTSSRLYPPDCFLERFFKIIPRAVDTRIICPMAMFEP